MTRYILCEGVRIRCWEDGAVVYAPGSAETVLLASAMVPFLVSLVASGTEQPVDGAAQDANGHVVRTLLRQNAIKAMS